MSRPSGHAFLLRLLIIINTIPITSKTGSTISRWCLYRLLCRILVALFSSQHPLSLSKICTTLSHDVLFLPRKRKPFSRMACSVGVRDSPKPADHVFLLKRTASHIMEHLAPLCFLTKLTLRLAMAVCTKVCHTTIIFVFLPVSKHISR
jgi:hypothetical protein